MRSMLSCSELCVSRIQSAVLASSALNGDIANLPQELRERICSNEATCEALCANWGGGETPKICVGSLVFGTLCVNVARVFSHVVALDVVHMPSLRHISMPSVRELRLRGFHYADIDWVVITLMFKNLEAAQLNNRSQRFTFTESWVSGAVFPKLTKLKIRAVAVLFEPETPKAQKRCITHICIRTWDGGCAYPRIYEMLDSAAILSFVITEDSREDPWWRSVRTLKTINIIAMRSTTVFSFLMRPQARRLGTEDAAIRTYCSLPIMRHIFDFVDQEKNTLRRLNLDLLAFEQDYPKIVEAGKRLFRESTSMQIILIEFRSHVTSSTSRIVIFLPTPQNIEWIARKFKYRRADDHCYVVSPSREIALLSLGEQASMFSALPSSMW